MFDQTNGQVFKEWTIPRQSISAEPDRLDWSRQRPYPLFTPRGARGPRSLVDMTINVIANNIGDVSEAHFDAIPPNLLWRVWRFLEARGVCLHAWKLFSKLLLDEDDDKTLGLYRFRQHLCRPSEELTRYTQPLSSLSADFITHLVISGGCTFTPHEILSLAEMRNLGVLELIQPADDLRAVFPPISDRLIRGWTEKKDPFPLLRILRIWGDQTTTRESLQWVSKFPSLALYDVMGDRDDWRSSGDLAMEQGWELCESPSRLEDSLLRYLLLFSPQQITASNRSFDMARSIDSDLTSLCSDSGCVVKFVTDPQAPPLLDYLTDNAKAYTRSWDIDASLREAGGCHAVAFEAWAFWLYSLLGQLRQDRDLKERGISSDTQAVAGPFVLPSKPWACVHLGHSGRGGIAAKPSYVSRGLFATKRYTFTRENALGASEFKETHPIPKKETSKPVPLKTVSGLPLRRNKRKRLEDVLQGFSK